MGETQPAGDQAAGTPAVVVRPFGLLSPGTATVLAAYVLAVSVAQGISAVAGHDIHLGTTGNLTSTSQLGGWLAHPPAWLASGVLAAASS